jgi:signal transduction histidine kinase
MVLCSNAVHAMQDKGGVLEVSLGHVEMDDEAARQYPDLRSGPYIELRVKDTGHGIDPEIMERIFDPFFTTKKQGEGIGMGLAVVHGIVKGYKGAIAAQSEPGKGTTFTILLPAVKADALEVNVRV